MRNASVWVIASGAALSLILGLVAPIDEAAERRNGSDLTANTVCVPFVASDAHYVKVEWRPDAPERAPTFDF